MARPGRETSNQLESDRLLDTLAEWSDYLKGQVRSGHSALSVGRPPM